jgi:Ca2+-binding RTX toxin-like protein
LWAAALIFQVLVLASPAQAAPSCFGRQATIVGTNGRDNLRGTPGRDVIVGKGKRDRINGRGGNDLICGGGGGDLINGKGGNDKIKGEGGSDALFGAGGNDRLELGPAVFQFATGGPGDDRIVGLPFPQGFDFVGFVGATQGATVDLGAGTATGQGTDTLVNIDGVDGTKFDDMLTGSAGSNFIAGLGGNDTIDGAGNAGDFDSPATIDELRFDFLAGDGGDDTLTGGAGTNVAAYDTANAGVNVDLQTGQATGQGTDTLNGINVVLGTQFDDTFRGDNNDNGFEGEGGTDDIDGRNGEDVLIFVDARSAIADLGTGTGNTIYPDFSGGGGGPIVGSLTLAGLEHIWGSNGGDSFTGDGEANEIFGLGGADDLNGAAGDDTLLGGGGADDADGGADNDICVAETEANCESDPAAAAAARSAMVRGWRSFR